eukprot:TRINITY_DN50665_c0_g1_i1.p1 TRINITY_DN50665_c0_g1~~TRINITY_DN50665_c0_g1_i1.p1  ORF type:complete len:545 (-),score=90.73 TRINITY_DN50665_c0_g1_i1:85-1719(-)
MEATRIDAVDPPILFDLLKAWISNTFHREIRDTKPPGCPWQALADALCESLRQQQRDLPTQAAPPGPSEKDIRAALIHTYRHQPDDVIQAIAQAKLEDELSFFALAKYSSSDEVLMHWDWYIYCLAFESSDFHSDGLAWDREPQADPEIVRMPMDFVDLHVLARYFKAQVTVSMLQHNATRFIPDKSEGCQHALHLVMHRGFWAPLLGPIDIQRKSSVSLVGSIVELGDRLGGSFEAFAGCTACVLGYDRTLECWKVCVGQHVLPIESAQIKQITCHISEVDGNGLLRSTTPSLKKKFENAGPTPGLAPALLGIPDGSVEFQIMYELVDNAACRRLKQLRGDIAGRIAHAQREGLQDPTLNNSSVSGPEVRQTNTNDEAWVSLTEVIERLKKNCSVNTVCPNHVSPPLEFHHQLLACEEGDQLSIVDVCGEGGFAETGYVFFGCATNKAEKRWVNSDLVCLWMVVEDYTPCELELEEFLHLEQNAMIVMTRRLQEDLPGWAMGWLVSDHEKRRQGRFPVRNVVPMIYIDNSICDEHDKIQVAKA